MPILIDEDGDLVDIDFDHQDELRAELARQQEQRGKGEPDRRHSWDNEVVLYFWLENVGHAAMKTRVATPSRSHVHYISWWPGEGPIAPNPIAALLQKREAGEAQEDYSTDKWLEMRDTTAARLLSGEFTPTRGQQLTTDGVLRLQDRDTGQMHITEDFMYERAADVKLALPGIGSAPFWLHTTAPISWFSDFVRTDGKYKGASRHHNCAGVVRTALKRAGAQAYVAAPDVAIYAKPSEILSYGRSLVLAIQGLNRRVAMLKQRFPMSISVVRNTLKLLPGQQLDQRLWKAASRRRSGIRGQNVRSLDNAVERLHATQPFQNPTQYLKAKRKIFETVERAIGRPGRDAHDSLALLALMHYATT